LFETEPSGALAEYKAIAIGKNRNEAMALLEKDYSDNINFDNAITLAIKALQKGLEEKEKMDAQRLDFAYIDEKKIQFKKITKEKLKPYLGNIR
jgi:proteasome alpha subunit